MLPSFDSASVASMTGASFMRPDGAPGDILRLIKELRERVGSLAPQEKELPNGRKLNFRIRPMDVLIDRVRPAANELGLVIVPMYVNGRGEVLKGEADGENGGTYAEVTVVVRAIAISDGTYLDFSGFGLGADQQDKAGGKAGTYAYKQALLQGLLAGGGEDTDDDDAPLKGGPKKKAAPKAKGAKAAGIEDLSAKFRAANTPEEYRALLPELTKLDPDAQVAIRAVIVEAKARCIPSVPVAGTADAQPKPHEGAA